MGKVEWECVIYYDLDNSKKYTTELWINHIKYFLEYFEANETLFVNRYSRNTNFAELQVPHTILVLTQSELIMFLNLIGAMNANTIN